MKYLFLLVTSTVFAQQTQYVDFKSVSGHLNIDCKQKKISGVVTYSFDVLKDVDTINIDAQKMDFYDVELNNRDVTFLNSGKQLKIIYPFKEGKNEISFKYSVIPKQALYFVGSETSDDLQIWTQGQGKYTSNWFPSFDDVNEKVVFNIGITYDSDYHVISNGILKDKMIIGETTFWQYQMDKPMSSYLLMLAIGKFNMNSQFSKSGVPLELYLENKDSLKFESTYRYSSRIFDFLEREIGVKYPWQIYREIPVRDFLYAGMENTTSTLFSTRYVVDKTGFEDHSYTNVDAHELAHQWFGDLVTAKSGKHHWLQEGFATYYALLAEKEIYGEDYFYSELYESALQIKQASKTDTIPVLNEKASSLSFYQKGAWALFVLHEAIGEKKFKTAVKNYLEKYAFQSVTTQDFLSEVNKVSNYNTDKFSKVWLESSSFNTDEVNKLLKKNKAISLLFKIEEMKSSPLSEKEIFFAEVLKSNTASIVKTAIVKQLKKEIFEDKKTLLQLALETNNIKVRQTVAYTVSKIPEDFRTQYESLLEDDSYETREIALLYLWKNFPKQRVSYLLKSKNWIGFNDYNLKTLWLSLAISTPEYLNNKQPLVDELVSYSSPNYDATTRQNALEKLIGFQLINDAVLINLVNATTHHMWQFSKYGRETIRTLIKNVMRSSFERILPNLNENEQFQLNRLLN